mmetsp:Transcript_12992/g.37032  ORF Transcript_12992/g.37032 Transcript_12992/m.37032 type:complete len:230 (-) Transcript_12992:23-712(-)
MRIRELFYVANIIDYGRVVLLYLAVQSSGYSFAAYYSGSYILDAFDGYAARALNQESRLGYYLDMVIDRVSSCVCLHFAANAVLSGGTCVPEWLAPAVAFALRASILFVEVLAHSVVMFMSEVRGVHQKQMGYNFTIVQKYLSDKRYLFWACASFEAFGLGLVVNLTPLVLLSLPGFSFRAAANLCRLAAAVLLSEDPSGECPRRGSSDRLGHHRSASPPGAQVLRSRR